MYFTAKILKHVIDLDSWISFDKKAFVHRIGNQDEKSAKFLL